MRARNRRRWSALLSTVSILGIACAEQQPTSVVQPSLATQAAAITGFTGHIVYTDGGTLHVYNLSTNTDVNLGVSGVNPKFSSDGSLIVFQSTKAGIAVMNADGTNQRVLVPSGGTPNFNPAATTVVFTANNGIASVSVNGGAVTQLSTDGGMHAAFSNDGTQIVYHAPINGTPHLVFMNADGSNPHAVSMPGAIIDVVWNPSGQVLFAMNTAAHGGASYHLFSYDPSTSTLAQLGSMGGFEPSWSPDALHISWSTGSNKLAGIWIMNADGTNPQGPAIAGARQGSWGP